MIAQRHAITEISTLIAEVLGSLDERAARDNVGSTRAWT
jgi:hypothetical protein